MKFIAFVALSFIFCIPLNSRAAAYWMEIIGNSKLNQPVRIQICYGNIDEFSIRHRDKGVELLRTGDFKIKLIDAGGQVTLLPLKQQGDCWEATFTPAQQGLYRIIGVNESHAVVDRSKTGGKMYDRLIISVGLML